MIDFHCHIDLYPDPRGLVRDCVERKTYVLSVTTTPSAWPGTYELAEFAPRIRTALGLHPQLARERKGELPLFEQFLPETKFVGEIGLDGSPECKGYWADQQFVFGQILAACVKVGGRILSVHSRRAATPVLDTLADYPDAGATILHWFSGSQKELERAIALGCWFSVGPAMLVGKRGRLLVSKMPRDRVLTESDGPFARNRDQPLYPWDSDLAVDALASIWSMPKSEVTEQLGSNFKRLGTLLNDRCGA